MLGSRSSLGEAGESGRRCCDRTRLRGPGSHPWSRRPAHQARRQARRASGRSIGRNCDWPPSLASPARPGANHRGHARQGATSDRARDGVEHRSGAGQMQEASAARRRNEKRPLADRHQSASSCSNEAPADNPSSNRAKPALVGGQEVRRDVPQRTMGGCFDCDPSSIGRTPKNISSPTITSARYSCTACSKPRCCAGM